MSARRFAIITMGCQMNVGDSDYLARALCERGWERVEPDFSTSSDASESCADANKLDLAIINTCSVREKPEAKVHTLVGQLRERTGHIAVGGCVAQQLGQQLLDRHPEVVLVFGTDQVVSAPDAIGRVTDTPGLRLNLSDFVEEYPERGLLPGGAVDASAFVNIMQGCDNYCAYCIVPYTRGRQKSRPPRLVLEECADLLARGAVELTLLGQNVNSYASEGWSFSRLLHEVAALKGLQRLRFTTSHPKDIAPEVIDAFGQLDVLCPALHLPLQSGSDAVLAAMGRTYDTARYMDVVERLRAARPDIALSTDFIVGFPGETQEDFEATLSMLRRVDFATSFSFIYSDRPGTAAEMLPGKISREVARERLQRLQALQDELSAEWYARMLGRTTTLLLEGPSPRQPRAGTGDVAPVPPGMAVRGRMPQGFTVNAVVPVGHALSALQPEALRGRLVQARIIGARKHSLVGVLQPQET